MLNEGHNKKFGVNEEPTGEKKNIKPPAQRPTKSKVVVEVETQVLPEIMVSAHTTYIKFSDNPSNKTVALEEGLVNADYDSDGELIGIEIVSPVIVNLNSEHAQAVIPSTILDTNGGE